MSLNYMLKTGKIKDIKHAGQVSLYIKQTSSNGDVGIASVEEIQDMTENLGNSSYIDGMLVVDGYEGREKQ